MYQSFMFILDRGNIKTLGTLDTLEHFRHLIGYNINNNALSHGAFLH